MSRLVCQIDRICLGLPGRPTFVAMATSFALGTESKKVKVKQCIAVNGTPISQLRDVTCRMGSHSVTCHPTQVNAPHLNPSQ